MKRLIGWFLLVVLSCSASARGNELLAQYDRPRRAGGDDSSYSQVWNGVPFLDLFGFQGGLWYTFFDGSIELDKAKVIGTPVKLGPGLGLEDPETVPVVSTYFKYEWKDGPALRMEASYFWFRFEGSEEAKPGEEFWFEGWPIIAGSQWDSKMDVMQGKLNLRITPYVIDMGLIQIRPSIYGGSMFMRWILRLNMTNNPGSVGDNGQIKDEFSATLGHIGLHLEVRVWKIWFYLWGSGMQFHRNELFANYAEGGGGVKFEILPFLLVQAEGYIFRARLDRNDQYRLEYSMYGPSFNLVLKY